MSTYIPVIAKSAQRNKTKYGEANCLRCGWTRNTNNMKRLAYLGEVVRDHVATTGHIVEAVYTTTIEYGPEK